MPTKQDNDTSRPDLRPDFLQEMGVSPEEQQEMEANAKAGAAKDLEKRTGLSGDSLREAEEAGGTPEASSAESKEGEEAEQSLYRDEGRKKRKKRLNLTRNQKIAGGAFGTLITGGSIAFFMTFMPMMRLESYMARINQRAFALAGNAVEARLGYLAEKYMIAHVINLEKCTRVNSIDCRADYSNKGIASGLFTAWRDARIEEKLFDRYGIQVESTRNNDGSGRHKLLDRRGAQITFGEGGFKGGEFTGGKNEFGKEMRLFLKQETKWYEIMHRRSLRNYLTRKHGIRLYCFFACKTRDNIELKKTSAITRYKYRFVERFIYPFSSKYGFIMTCMISAGGKCSSEELRKRGIDRTKIPDADVTDIIDNFGRRGNKSLFSYVIEKLLKKVMSAGAAKATVSAIPIAGQIYFGLTVLDMLDRMDQFVEDKQLSKLASDINARQYLEFYTGMRSVNDEMKSYETGLEEVGAVMTDFQGAEDSRVFQVYNKPTPTIASLFGGNVYAQAAQQAQKEPYTCDDGKPIPEGELVCEEKKIARTFLIEDIRANPVVSSVSNIANQYGRCIGFEIVGRCPQGEPKKYIRPVLEGIDWLSSAIIGPIADGILGVAEKFPPIRSFLDTVKNAFGSLMRVIFEAIFPLPVDIDSPGREKYDGLEAGADVAAMEFGKGGYTEANEPYGLGAPAISDAQAASIYEDYLEQQEYEYRNQGLLAKLTDMDYPDSFINNFIDSTPTNTNEIPTTMATSFSSFISGLVNLNFLSPFVSSTRPAYAASQLSANAFGVTRYGYPANDPSFTQEPERLTDDYCNQTKEARLKSLYERDLASFDEYSVSDPCLLERVTVEAAGALFTNE